MERQRDIFGFGSAIAASNFRELSFIGGEEEDSVWVKIRVVKDKVSKLHLS